MGRTVRIGKVMITPSGQWESGIEYDRLSLVYHEGNGYVSLVSNTGVEPGTDATTWMLVLHSPVLTTDDDGNLYVDGVVISSAVQEALTRVEQALDQIEDAIERAGQAGVYTFDDVPMRNSNNPVKSGGIYSALQGKVSNVPGKDLSSNDFTTPLKEKLDGIEAGAKKNVQSDWNADSGDAMIKNKPDLSGFITKTVNDLANYYLKSETYTRAEVQALIASVSGTSYESVSVLPEASASTMGKIYLVPKSDPLTRNIKEEYITIESSGSYSWELIGNTEIDLSGYVSTSDLNTALASYVTSSAFQTALAAKQDTISDLSTIRSGADAGASAYQKPANGIPQTDLASAVTTLLQKIIASITSQQDGAVVFTLVNGDVVTVDFNHVHPQYISKAVETEQPSGGFKPDVVYKLGTISGAVTFALANPVVGNTNHYFWTFDTDSTAPTVTWPSGITWADGTGPTVAASKHYEISILDGIAAFTEV